MTTTEFNEKWSEYLEEGHYGLAIEDPEVIEYLDSIFKDLTKIPGFQYSQIKWKYDTARFYADGISGTLQRTIEKDIEERYSFDLINFLDRQKAWSRLTFGPPHKVNRVEGLLKHIEEEIEEVREAPNDLEEWIDILILTLDGCWRIGATNKEITQKLDHKLQKNKEREWPDWRSIGPDKPLKHES